MSEQTHKASRAVRLSTEVYRRLLVVYPQAFRRQYGAHMAQVFRDCCRETAHTNGMLGLWRYWLIAFSDLVVSAIAERRREELSMSPTTWIRIGSLAAIVGGVTTMLLQFPNIALLLTSLSASKGLVQDRPFLYFDPGGLVQDRPFLYYSREAWATTPVIWLLFVLALVGLRASGASRLGTLGRIGTVIGIIGATLIGVGDAVIAAVPLSQGIACVPPTCTFYDPRHFASLGRTAVVAGVALFLVGMILYSVVTLRRHILAKGWGNALPLFLGALGLLSAVVVTYNGFIFYTFHGNVVVRQVVDLPLQNWDANQALGFDLPSTGLGVSMGNAMTILDLTGIVIASFIFALSWIALGKMIWPGEQKETEAQVRVVEPTAN